MFKKPLANVKTSAPLRSSDRRKLKQRVLAAFALPPEDGDLLVPEGILTAKFTTHLDVPGVVYIASDCGDPLWLTIGKGNDELIPTVYTMWKRPTMLPFICTPSEVIPVLVNGADLMIPGVMFHSSSLVEGQLVAICQYERTDGASTMSVPLAIGRMAVTSDQLEGGKGKAALLVHAWKDNLWDMGSKLNMPEPSPIGQNEEKIEPAEQLPDDVPLVEAGPEERVAAYSKDEVSTLLRLSLLQCISTVLTSLPMSTFPVPLSTFYSTYVLPCRPAFPSLVLPSSLVPDPNPHDITIKSSSYKSFSAFIKVVEKENLLATKAPQKHAQQAETVITSVNGKHSAVQVHQEYVTIGELEAKAARKAQREEEAKEKEAQAMNELEVRELWKPHAVSVELFQAMNASTSQLYAISEIRTLVNEYIIAKDIINAHDKAYINLDDLLRKCIRIQTGKKTPAQPQEEFIKREELHHKVVQCMQPWHEVRGVAKKGQLVPIQVDIKVRQGRKTSTLITCFEPFLVVAEDMAEELRKVCAGATSVSPLTGGKGGMEVLVQGKQVMAVTAYLRSRGVPERWIQATSKVSKKK